MHKRRVDLNLYLVFDAIYSEGGITRASEKLNLTQPAISHALARLRAVYDDALFLRQGREMVPTPLARRMIEPVRQALTGLAATMTDLDRFEPATERRRFTLAVHENIEMTMLPPLVERIARGAPNVDVFSIRSNRTRMENELSAGTIDAAIDILLPVGPDIRRQRISASPLVVVVRRDHPRIGDSITLDQYLAEGHILASSRRKGVGLEDIELGRLGHVRRIRVRCRHFQSAGQIVSGTDYLLTVSSRYLDTIEDGGRNRVLPLPFEMPPLEMFLYWHAAVDNDPANRWLRQATIETGRDIAERGPT